VELHTKRDTYQLNDKKSTVNREKQKDIMNSSLLKNLSIVYDDCPSIQHKVMEIEVLLSKDESHKIDEAHALLEQIGELFQLESPSDDLAGSGILRGKVAKYLRQYSQNHYRTLGKYGMEDMNVLPG
jgi:hypothetical protein